MAKMRRSKNRTRERKEQQEENRRLAKSMLKDRRAKTLSPGQIETLVAFASKGFV